MSSSSPEACWDENIRVTDDQEAEEATEFEQAFDQLVKRKNLLHYLKRLDTLACLGHYSVLVLGVADSADKLTDPIGNVPNGIDGLAYLETYGQENAQIAAFNHDKNDPNYGRPSQYELHLGGYDIQGTSASATFQESSEPIHYSRVIHVAQGALENDIIGKPILSPILNSLMDLEKVTGGAAEAFWLNARGGIHLDYKGNSAPGGVVQKDADIDDLDESVDEFVNQMSRVITTEGADVKVLQHPNHSPQYQFEIILKQIAGAIGVPQRILVGNEAGEQASSQDITAFNSRVRERTRTVLWSYDYTTCCR